jgi:hypothetical protein
MQELKETFNGIQEMVQKDELKESFDAVKRNLEAGYFDFNEASLMRVDKPAIREKVLNSLRSWPLREFLAKSGTTGISGAAYLVPDKIYQILFDCAVETDIVADISIAMVGPEAIPGSTLKVDIIVDGQYKPKKFMSGGMIPTETLQTTQATLDFTNGFAIHPRITNDLIEDQAFDVMEMHLRNAGKEMGEYATNEALMVMMLSTDGDGTLNTEAGGADSTTLTNVFNAVAANINDGYVSDTYVSSHHQWLSAIAADTTYSQNAVAFRDNLITNGYPTRLFGMNCIFNECDALTKALGINNALEDLNSFVFTKAYALLSGRKRWMRIENYSEPMKDLVGCVVSARQDSVTIYNDSICRIRET